MGCVCPALTFETTFVDLRGQTTFEGEVIRIQNSLINHTSRPILVKSIPASCGCLAIRQNDEPLSFPVRLGPRDRLPLDIKIYTESRYGEQQLTARAEGTDEREEKYESPPLNIAFRVISRIFVIPDAHFIKVKATGKDTATVRLTYLVAARGEICNKLTIETAHKQQFQFDVKKSKGTIDHNGLKLNKCFEVGLCYLPTQGTEMFAEILQFIPDDQPALAKTIRFDGLVEYPYRLEPEKFVILSSGKEPQITETAVYRFTEGVFCNLQVRILPKGFRLQITDYDQNAKLLTFHINREEVDWQKAEDRIVFSLGQGEALEIPVRKIKLD